LPDDDAERRDSQAYATAYHAPVLWREVVDALITDPGGLYVDATLGGGGHSAALLDTLGPEGRVVGLDQDERALATACARLADAYEAGRFQAMHTNFGILKRALDAAGIDTIDGLLLDLGVSWHQIDEAERGFSFWGEGPLDMRMDERTGLTAEQIVNRWDERALKQTLSHYGEERRAGRVARSIVAARPLTTTHDLAAAVRRVVPDRDEVKSLARVFQALRIAVNDELDMLERALEQAAHLVRPGGRIAVISYHSLEDRRVKRYLRYGNFAGEPVRDFYGNLVAPWAETPREPIEASTREVKANPRARSARLRVAERRPDDAAGAAMPMNM
jgi:16S rRNA (cytosine1402-N4)-methyltransferase